MKKNIITSINCKSVVHAILLLSMVSILNGCDNEDPVKEDTPELITRVTLTFTPTGGGADVVGIATDPDGEGIQNLAPDGPINLVANKSYVLAISLINELA